MLAVLVVAAAVVVVVVVAIVVVAGKLMVMLLHIQLIIKSKRFNWNITASKVNDFSNFILAEFVVAAAVVVVFVDVVVTFKKLKGFN